MRGRLVGGEALGETKVVRGAAPLVYYPPIVGTGYFTPSVPARCVYQGKTYNLYVDTLDRDDGLNALYAALEATQGTLDPDLRKQFELITGFAGQVNSDIWKGLWLEIGGAALILGGLGLNELYPEQPVFMITGLVAGSILTLWGSFTIFAIPVDSYVSGIEEFVQQYNALYDE